MKSVIAVSMFPLLVSLGCGGRFSGLENDAVEHVREYCKLTTLGGSTFLCEARAGDRTVMLFELRNPRFDIYTSGVSNADTLNGVQWRGEVCLRVDAFRRYPASIYGDGSHDIWSDWEPEMAPKGLFSTTHRDYFTRLTQVRKINGEWEVTPEDPDNGRGLASRYDVTFKKVEPSDIPGGPGYKGPAVIPPGQPDRK